MKIIVPLFLAFLTAVTAKNINFKDVIDLKDITAFGYHNKIGIPLADKIRKAEMQQSSRITGGSAALLGQFPYQAGLVTQFPTRESLCGGCILTPWRVLTAAHCWFDGEVQALWFTVVTGSLTLFYGGQRIQTNNIIIHENYNPDNIRNDIAMIIMPTAIVFSDIVGPIALPSGNELNEDFVNSIATASGFGLTGYSSITVDQFLSHVDLPVITNAECTNIFGDFYVADSTLCISGAGGKSTCTGDSGGPLVVTRNNRRILIGVTSFTAVSCISGFPAGFARVTSYMSWIQNLL